MKTPKGIEIIDDFLPDDDFNLVLNSITQQERRTFVASDGEGWRTNNEDTNNIVSLINKTSERAKPDLLNFMLKDVIYRYENKAGGLHHDLNKRKNRRYSLILYLEEPIAGGEIVFPLYDSNGREARNPVKESCEDLHKKGVHFNTDESLVTFINKNKNNLYSQGPRANLAIILDNTNERLWHYVCPVEEGFRSCVVMFWEKE
jgi:hypothetical protein